MFQLFLLSCRKLPSCKLNRRQLCSSQYVFTVSIGWNIYVCVYIYKFFFDTYKSVAIAHLCSLNFKLHVIFSCRFPVFTFFPAVTVPSVTNPLPAVEEHGPTSRPDSYLFTKPLLVPLETNQNSSNFLEVRIIECTSLNLYDFLAPSSTAETKLDIRTDAWTLLKSWIHLLVTQHGLLYIWQQKGLVFSNTTNELHYYKNFNLESAKRAHKCHVRLL